MRVNIICSDEGWIYSKFIEMFRKYSKHEILLNVKKDFDIVHYLPYYEIPAKKLFKPSTAWMSHQEAKDPLKTKFIAAARAVNVAISQSKKYADILKRNRVGKVAQIMPGVDLGMFKMRDGDRQLNKKLIVGFCGRQYSSSNRKNPVLLKKISELPFIEFRVTGGKVEEKNISKFYADVDLIVSPSLTEGGPMCLIECLSVGTPIICFENVGIADEFTHGVIKVPYNDSDEFLGRLKTIWATKSYLHYRKPQVMRDLRKQVKDFTWENFVKQHDAIWKELVK